MYAGSHSLIQAIRVAGKGQSTRRDSFSRPDPCHLAWLLRPDVHGEGSENREPNQVFRQWWVLEGALEYPVWGRHHGERSQPHWFLPENGSTAGVGPFPVTPAFRYVMARRLEVSDQLDLTTPLGLSRAMAWFFVHGIRECRLSELVPEAMLTNLAAPVDFLGREHGAAPCWLAFFAWLCDARLQTRFKLGTPEGNEAYTRFFAAKLVDRLQLHALIQSPRKPSLRRIAKPRGTPRKGLPVSRPHSNGVNLIGHAYGELGIGEDLRMAVEACEAAGIPYAIVNFSPGASTRQDDRLLAGRTGTAGEAASAPYATNIFCLTAFETARLYLEHGPGLFEGRRNIGWWPWELPVWPERWRPALNLVDEIWAASRFSQDAYQAAMGDGSNIPVHLMPLSVSVARRAQCIRQQFGLPARKFLFLYLFDANSWWSRKNPIAILKAFQRAFPASDQDVGLVFKVSHSGPQDRRYREFMARCASDQRVHVLSGVLDRPDVLGLMDVCDAYVSLHRSEGFGRTLAEALLLGKPVVGTDFSGNIDFLNEKNGFPVACRARRVKAGEYAFIAETDGARWAEPNILDAARQMRAARAAAGREFSRALAARMADVFSPLRIGTRMRDAMRAASPLAVESLG